MYMYITDPPLRIHRMKQPTGHVTHYTAEHVELVTTCSTGLVVMEWMSVYFSLSVIVQITILSLTPITFCFWVFCYEREVPSLMASV